MKESDYLEMSIEFVPLTDALSHPSSLANKCVSDKV